MIDRQSYWYKIFLEHPNSTDNPQGYWSHGLFSIKNSLKGLWYMKLGVIHGLIPYFFPFSTSSHLIRSFKILVKSERHKDELRQIIDENTLAQLKKDISAEVSSGNHPDLNQLVKLKRKQKGLDGYSNE
jgi:hypothetical protein